MRTQGHGARRAFGSGSGPSIGSVLLGSSDGGRSGGVVMLVMAEMVLVVEEVLVEVVVEVMAEMVLVAEEVQVDVVMAALASLA